MARRGEDAGKPARPPGIPPTLTRLLLLALAGTGCAEPPCAPGFERTIPGYCMPSASDAPGGDPADSQDTGAPGTDTGLDDTAAPTIAWQALPDRCDAPAELGPDPVWKQGEFFLQSEVFAEIVDLEVDEIRAEVWAAGQGGVLTLDISRPAAPTLLSDTSPSRWAQRAYNVHIGPYPAVYATHRDFGLVAYDRTDPTAPAQGALIDTPHLSGLTSADGLLYVAGLDGSLHTYDIASDPQAPASLSVARGLGNAWQPVVSGDWLYVADNTLGVVILDRSDPADPRVVGAADTAGGAQDLALSADGTTLYVAVGGAGVEVFDLSVPDAPASLGSIDLASSAIGVAASGDLLWAVTQQDVVAIDISTPSSPALINTDETTQWAMAVAAGAERAYVGDWGYLAVYRTNPTIAAPDAHPSSTRVHVAPGGDAVQLRVANLGAAPLSLLGATVSDPALTVDAEAASVPAGEEIRLRVTSTADTVDAIVCLATDDPDEPLHELRVTTGGVGGSALGQPAPDFALQDLDGRTWRLSEQAGHPVVLAYFATW